MNLTRPYHWQLRTNHGWLDAIGATEKEAGENLLRRHKLLYPSQHLAVLLGRGKCGRIVDYEYWKWLKKHHKEKNKVEAICSLCENSIQVRKVSEALGVDVSWALGHWATTPRKKNTIAG